MISLILTCKVNDNKRRITSAMTGSTYTPIPYPMVDRSGECSSFDILLKSIRSYASFEFKSAVFYIDIEANDDGVRSSLFKTLTEVIEESISSNNTILKYSRPSCKNEWLSFVADCTGFIGEEPIIVSMNHDHLMVDENKGLLKSAIYDIYKSDPDVLLAYSHIPESISWGLIGLGSGRFSIEKNGPYRLCKTATSDWLDSIYVMNLNKFRYIFQSIKEEPVYLPRFDWPGVVFYPLRLRTVVVPVSFFRHYDGYGHVTGIRLDRLFSDEVKSRLQAVSDCTSSAYCAFLEIFYIYFRDALLECKLHGSKRKDYFIQIAECCFDFYLKGNLLLKYRDSMTIEKIDILNSEIKMLFYHDFNLLYSVIQEDVCLNAKHGISNFLRRMAKKLIQW